MNIVIAEFRHVVIDDVRNSADIDAAADHVCGDEQANLPGSDSLHHAVAFALLKVAVQRFNFGQLLAKLVEQFVGSAFLFV